MRCPATVRRILAVAWAEWLYNRRDPRSLAIIVGLPLSLLLLYGYAIDFDLQELRFAVLDLDRTERGADVVRSMVASEYFTLHGMVEDGDQIRALIDSGEIRLALVIPRGFGEKIASGGTGEVQVLLDGSDSTTAGVALGYLEGVLREHSVKLVRQWVRERGLPAAVAEPALTLEPRALYNPEMRTVEFIVPGLIAVIMTMLAALLTSGCIVREREIGSFEGLAASPIAPVEIVLGKLLPYAAISIVDVILCIGAGAIVFGVFPLGNKLALILIAGLYLVASLAIGLAISSVARSRQVATLVAFLATLLPSTLLTGFVFPVRSMPPVLQYIAQIFPATHFLVIIRAIYLKGTGLALYLEETAALVVIALALVALASKSFRKSLE
ncbi:MAG: ABC transporter permease [candidate division WS1 bacterium]|nr:ABC transporter permease [candidate division WS1 bacterium]